MKSASDCIFHQRACLQCGVACWCIIYFELSATAHQLTVHVCIFPVLGVLPCRTSMQVGVALNERYRPSWVCIWVRRC